jgi:hypothetical protein
MGTRLTKEPRLTNSHHKLRVCESLPDMEFAA